MRESRRGDWKLLIDQPIERRRRAGIPLGSIAMNRVSSVGMAEKWIRIVALLALLVSSCAKPGHHLPGLVVEPARDLQPYYKEAQRTLPEFLAAVGSRRQHPSRERYQVKAAVVDWDGRPYSLWFSVNRFVDGELHVIAELPVPARLSTYQRLLPEKVLDWLYWDQGKLVGGYSLRGSLENVKPPDRPAAEEHLRHNLELWRWFSESDYCDFREISAPSLVDGTPTHLAGFQFLIPGGYSETVPLRRSYHGGKAWLAPDRDLIANVGHFGCGPQQFEKRPDEFTCSFTTSDLLGLLYSRRNGEASIIGAIFYAPRRGFYDLSLSTTQADAAGVREYFGILRSVAHKRNG